MSNIDAFLRVGSRGNAPFWHCSFASLFFWEEVLGSPLPVQDPQQLFYIITSSQRLGDVFSSTIPTMLKKNCTARCGRTAIEPSISGILRPPVAPSFGAVDRVPKALAAAPGDAQRHGAWAGEPKTPGRPFRPWKTSPTWKTHGTPQGPRLLAYCGLIDEEIPPHSYEDH